LEDNQVVKVWAEILLTVCNQVETSVKRRIKQSFLYVGHA
jgi:hypothetical protein